MIKKRPLANALLIALGLISPLQVFAQQQNENSKDNIMLEVIEVTAQKRVQGFLEVPVAVTSVSGETLEAAQATEFQDLVQISPSVTFNQSGDMRGSGVNIRGIGTTAFQTAVEPTVSTVIDGVPLGRTVQFLSDLADIDRVEILRGPQGTLFGKNASGGVISVYTKRPEEFFFGETRLTLSDDNAYGIMGQVTGPLSDGVRGRLAFYSRDFDGFVENVTTGETINGDNSKGFRGKLELDVGSDGNLLLIGDYSKQDRDCCTTILKDVNRDSFFDFLQYGEDYADIDLGPENNKVKLGSPVYSNTETSGISAEYNHNFGDFTLTSISAFRGFTLESAEDADLNPYTTPVTGHVLFTKNGASGGGNQEQSQFSEELRIAGQLTDDIFITMGAFYWEQSIERYFEREVMRCADPYDAEIGTEACSAAGSGIGFNSFDSIVDTTNYALFSQAEWGITDDLTASLGLRYTHDEIEIDFARGDAVLTGPFPGMPGLPGAAADFSSDTTDSAVTGRFSLAYNLNKNSMIFGSYAEGYKAPAFDLIFSSTESSTTPIPAETNKAWEAGIRSELLDRRLRLSFTGFHTTFEHFQGQAYDPQTITFSLTSAGEVITKGLEVEFTAKPIPELLINGGIAFIDATYGEFLGVQCYFGQTQEDGCNSGFQDINGGDVPNSPNTKLTLSAKYDIYLEGNMDMFISANYRWRDEAQTNQNQSPDLILPSYGVLDFTLGIQADDGQWTAALFAKNALDDNFVSQLSPGFLDPSNTSMYLTRDYQRYMGVEFTYRFGAF
ncbi:TonB-dependent receptor [uncultured Paraglaciecola sp.]|uniref:TonB-dependent receptor n=1 Tax=uncultured Paraglaciecola sp. TaxID=1765024 RepID=UPI0030DC1CDB|tara:strand:- start:11178 stop:13526 length:2349 start_codon:yes stop_codon:yes gene_type:complete